MEMSMVLGSVQSGVDNDDDIVIDSGGRQINHTNNWLEFSQGKTQLYYQNQLQPESRQAEQTIVNRNRPPSGIDKQIMSLNTA